MPRPIRSIEIYLPLESNEGVPFPESRYVGLQHELLRRFGGVTSTQHEFPLQGLWKTSDEVFDDRVVVMSSMDFGSSTQLEAIRYLERLKARLKKKFAQLEILITVQELLAI